MKSIKMTLAQVESFTAQFKGDMSNIFFDGASLNVPDDLYLMAKAIDVSISPKPLRLKAYANQKQWALATGGFTASVGGASYQFSTEIDSMILMEGKSARFAKPNPPASINWQMPDGSWLNIPASEFDLIAIAIADFVQATFDALKEVEAKIDGGTIADEAGVDGYAWPASH